MSVGHRHLRLEGPHGRANVDLEPIFWADLIRRPGPLQAASQVFQIVLLIGLVDLIAAGVRVMHAFERATTPSSLLSLHGSTRLGLAMASALALCVRAAIVPLVAPLAAAAMLVPRERRRVGDALAWSLDETARGDVVRHVRAHVASRPHARLALLGHSQGGSIVTELEPALRSAREDVRLLTVGTGHGLLVAINRLLPRWGLWRSAILWPGLFLYAVGTLLFLLSATAISVQEGLPLLTSGVRWEAAIWFQDLDPPLSAALLRDAVRRFDLTLLTRTDTALLRSDLAWAVGTFGALVAMAAITLVGTRARLLRDALRTDAEGIDVIARRDPVSAVMAQLGEPTRVRPIRQCASYLWDHVSYFRNEAVAVPLLAREIEQMAAIVSADARATRAEEPGESLHGTELRGRRAVGPLAILGGTWLGGVLLSWAPASLAVAGTLAIAVLVAIRRTQRTPLWLDRVSAAVRNGSAKGEFERVERRARSRFWLLMLAAFAFPMIAAGAMLEAWQPFGAERADLVTLTQFAALAGVGLLVAIWLSAFSVAWAATFTSIALIVASAAWLLQATSAGTTAGLLLLVLAAWNFLRQARHRKRSAGRCTRRT